MAAEPTIIVLGAGINGAAIARELTLSGVGVIVVDGDDVASGTTAWSTRLIHGGLRYLEYGEIGLVRESLVERNRLVRLAAHLVRPLSFYLPVERRWGGLAAAAARLVGCESLARRLQGRRGRGSWTVGLGLTLYDLLAAGAGWPRHRSVRAGAAGMPKVDRQAFPWGGVYCDAQLLFPERFTVELLVDARSIAAAAGTRFEVCTHRQVRVGGDGMVTIGPSLHGEGAIEVQADAVINATGAWVDRTLAALFPQPAGSGGGPEAAGRRLIGGTKGSHLLVRCPALRAALVDYGVYCEAQDGRPVFVLPFGPELVLVGTTDIPFTGDPAEARADASEIDYLLAAVTRIFPAVGVGREQVQQHYCGVRPLPAVEAGAGTPAGITRRHLLVRHHEAILPLWSVVGGKLTTCRSLAELTAATVLGALRVPVRGTSRDRPLPGMCAGASRAAAVRACRELAEQAGAPWDEAATVAEHAVGLFGARAAEVWRAADARNGRGGLIRGVGLPTAAVGFCVREEWAVTLDDLIERRLMLSFHERLSREGIADVAEALAAAGGLPPDRVPFEVDACVARLHDRYGRTVPQGSAASDPAAGIPSRSQAR
jgi:glycerol-3-phosphate dehydrogenase